MGASPTQCALAFPLLGFQKQKKTVVNATKMLVIVKKFFPNIDKLKCLALFVIQ